MLNDVSTEILANRDTLVNAKVGQVLNCNADHRYVDDDVASRSSMSYPPLTSSAVASIHGILGDPFQVAAYPRVNTWVSFSSASLAPGHNTWIQTKLFSFFLLPFFTDLKIYLSRLPIKSILRSLPSRWSGPPLSPWQASNSPFS